MTPKTNDLPRPSGAATPTDHEQLTTDKGQACKMLNYSNWKFPMDFLTIAPVIRLSAAHSRTRGHWWNKR